MGKEIRNAEYIKIYCPCCGEEIVSPRGELNKQIAANAEKIRECLQELTAIKNALKDTKISKQDKENLLEKKEKISAKFRELNEISSQFKKKRSALAEHEQSSAYFALKKVIVDKYGNQGYIDCMNEVMKIVQPKEVGGDIKIIEI